MLTSIRRDIQAIRDRDPAARSALEIVLAYPGFHARELHRLAHALHQRGVPVVPRAISNFGRFVTGIEIHPGATIGEGLFIDHGMGVVIGETAEVGDDCHILQGVTLGGTSLHRTKRHPTLGRGVTVGAGAKLIGAVEIGDNARIGAGSVVVTSVPPNATVVGVPGHVVAYHDPGGDTITRLPDPEWDRIDGLERHVEELERRIRALQGQLERLGGERPPDARDTAEPAHLHRQRDGEPGLTAITGNEAVSG
ncbi:MAG TPA: serine O-acetyltransferase [Dehalococcoidia bacterium]|nr:serine O-acetyltransferase [Dehalococcoidia bacterium]